MLSIKNCLIAEAVTISLGIGYVPKKFFAGFANSKVY
jgi:hypothetical protein